MAFFPILQQKGEFTIKLFAALKSSERRWVAVEVVDIGDEVVPQDCTQHQHQPQDCSQHNWNLSGLQIA